MDPFRGSQSRLGAILSLLLELVRPYAGGHNHPAREDIHRRPGDGVFHMSGADLPADQITDLRIVTDDGTAFDRGDEVLHHESHIVGDGVVEEEAATDLAGWQCGHER